MADVFSGNLRGTRKPFQVGTGTLQVSAQLQADSTTAGFLPPRMDTVQRIAIAAPAEGLMVFDTDFKTYYVFQAAGWKQLSGTHVGDLAYYVDGTSGSDANGGTSWADAKKTFAFIQYSAKVVPRVIAGNLTFYVRGVVCSADDVRHTDLDEFIVSGTVTIQGEYTDVATGLAVNGYQDSTSNIAHHTYITTTGAGWTPGMHRGRYVHIGSAYYPILNNTTDTLTTYDLPDLTAVGTYAISTVSELRGALVSDPATLVAYSQPAVGMQKCVLGELRINAINFNFDRLLTNDNWLRFGVQSGNCTVYFMHVSLNAYLQMLENVKFAVVNYSYVDIDWDLITMDPEVIWSLQNSVVYASSRNGFGVVSATRASFYKCLITGQGIGLNCWYQNESSVVLQDCMFDDCGVGIQASGPTTLTGQTRFRGCDVAVLVASSVRTYASSTFLVDTTPVQLQMSDSDTATFAEIGTRVLANAAMGSSITVIDDTTSVMETPDEYDGTTSGLVATRYQTAIDEVVATRDLIAADRKEPTGFPYLEQLLKSQISFDNGLRRFTIGPKVPYASFHFWIQGTPYTKSAAETFDISDTEGLHVIYYDVGGTLAVLTNPTDAQLGVAIREKALVTFIYWDATNNEQIYFANERHGVVMDGIDHELWHWRFGSYLLSGGTLTNVVVEESGALAAHAQFGTVMSMLLDEDLTGMAMPVASTTGLPVYWRSGASGYWRRTVNAGFSVLTTGTGRLAWNQVVTGAWQQTEVTNNDFVLCHVFLTNDIANPFIAVMGQADYATVREARVGAVTEMNALVLSSLPEREWVAMASLILQTSDSYGNAVKARVRTTDDGDAYVSWLDRNITPTSGAIQSHNDFSGLNEGDYQHLTATDATLLTTNVEATNHFHIPNIVNRLTVGQVGSECDFTPTLGYGAIATAVGTAIGGGASASNPWQIDIYPGVYAEPKITMPAGVYLRATDTRMDTVFIAPIDPTDDLFVMTGGWMSGVHPAGVTTPGKWLINCSVEGTFTALHGVSLHGCSGGILVANGAQVVATNLSMLIGAAAMDIGVGVQVTGVGTFSGMPSVFKAAGFFAAVPAAVLPAYASNPIQRVLSVTAGAQGFVSTGSFGVAAKDATADVVFVDDGGFAFLSGAEMTGCQRALHIGSVGTGSQILTQGGNFTSNAIDVKIAASSGRVFLTQSVDELTTDLVAGAELIGMVQNRTAGNMSIIGDAKYQYLASGRQVDFADFFSDYASTGVCDGGEVTPDGGLFVNVAAGDGWCRRGTPNDDAKWVEWAASLHLELLPSATNYVAVNGQTAAVEVSASPPSYGDSILLRTIITDGVGIRYSHKTRNYLTGPMEQLRTYLLSTRKQALITGLIGEQGTGVRNIDVSAGSYYLGLDAITYAGAADATFSYFYGSGGATEVASQTQVSITQYDNAGTLTAMTTGYFRSDTLVLTSDGRLSLLYGTAQHTTQLLAEAAASGNIPTFIEPSAFPLYRVIVEEGAGIVSFVDIRPNPAAGTSGGGGAGTSDHSALSNLLNDDHTQYMLASGTRSMTGGLNMGSSNITMAALATVDGVDVSDHSALHLPGGGRRADGGHAGCHYGGRFSERWSNRRFLPRRPSTHHCIERLRGVGGSRSTRLGADRRPRHLHHSRQNAHGPKHCDAFWNGCNFAHSSKHELCFSSHG